MIDYAALADQYGATTVKSGTKKKPESGSVDYSALADEYGAVTVTPPTTKETVNSKNKNETIYLEDQPKEVPPVEEKQSFYDKYMSFSDRIGQLGAEFDVGAVKSIGSALGGFASFGNAILNPLGKAIDRATGTVSQDTSVNAGDLINKFGEELEKHTGVKEKNYLDNVFEGLGSTAPFLIGGVAGEALGIPKFIMNLGLSGTEALVNSYDDYQELTKDKTATGTDKAKAIASFGGNLLVNYFTNYLGFLSEAPAKGIVDSIKKFAIDGLLETGQETTQQLVSNLVTGKAPSDGLVDTALVSAPSAFLFGGVKFASNIQNVKAKEKIEKFVEDLAQNGASKSQIVDILSTTTGDPNIRDNEIVGEIINNNETLNTNDANKAHALIEQGYMPEATKYQLIQDGMALEDAQKAIDTAKSPDFVPTTKESVSNEQTSETETKPLTVADLSLKRTSKELKQIIESDETNNEEKTKDQEHITTLESKFEKAKKGTTERKQTKMELAQARNEFVNKHGGTVKAIKQLITEYAQKNRKTESLSNREMKQLTSDVVSYVTDPTHAETVDNMPLSDVIKGTFNQFAKDNKGRGEEKSSKNTVKREDKKKSEKTKVKEENKPVVESNKQEKAVSHEKSTKETKEKTVDKVVDEVDKDLAEIGNKNSVEVIAEPNQGNTVYIDNFTSKDKEKGNFKKTIRDIIAYANKTGKTISLTPGNDFDGSIDKKRLEATFRKEGFADNKNESVKGKLSYVPKEEKSQINQEEKEEEMKNPKETGLSKRLKVEALKNEMDILSDAGLIKFDSIKEKEQLERAVEFVNSEYDRALRVELGEEQAPEGILPIAISRELKKEAFRRGDKEAIRLIGTRSNTYRDISLYAQSLGLVEENPEDPASMVRKVANQKEKIVDKKLKKSDTTAQKQVNKKIKKMEQGIEESEPKKEDWSSFIESIKC